MEAGEPGINNAFVSRSLANASTVGHAGPDELDRRIVGQTGPSEKERDSQRESCQSRSGCGEQTCHGFYHGFNSGKTDAGSINWPFLYTS